MRLWKRTRAALVFSRSQKALCKRFKPLPSLWNFRKLSDFFEKEWVIFKGTFMFFATARRLGSNRRHTLWKVVPAHTALPSGRRILWTWCSVWLRTRCTRRRVYISCFLTRRLVSTALFYWSYFSGFAFEKIRMQITFFGPSAAERMCCCLKR